MLGSAGENSHSESVEKGLQDQPGEEWSGGYESGVGNLGVGRMSQVKGASCTKLGEQERCDGLFQVEGSEQRTRGGT